MSLFLSKLITPGKNYFSKCSCKYSLQFQFLNSYDLLKYAFKTLSKLKTIISESEKYGQLFKTCLIFPRINDPNTALPMLLIINSVDYSQLI